MMRASLLAPFLLQVILMSVLHFVSPVQQPISKLQANTNQFFQHELQRSSYFDRYSLGSEEGVVYHPSLVSSPGLPRWLHYTQRDQVHPGYLYGTPMVVGNYNMEIFGENRDTFETSRVLLRIEVIELLNVTFPQHHVTLLIQNHNIEDLLNITTQTSLTGEIAPLWGPGAQVSIYGMESDPVQQSRPLPNGNLQKHGVQVTLSSAIPPTNLQSLINMINCDVESNNPVPASATNLQGIFEVAWCRVTFATITDDMNADSTPQPIYLGGEFVAPVRRVEESSDFLGFLLIVVLPTALLLVIVSVLCCLMFCNRQGIEKRNYGTTGIQLAHHSMIRQASQELRNLSNRRDGGPTPIGTPQQIATPNLRGRRTPTRTVLPHQTPPPPYRLPPDARNQQETSFSHQRGNRRSSEPSHSKGR